MHRRRPSRLIRSPSSSRQRFRKGRTGGHSSLRASSRWCLLRNRPRSGRRTADPGVREIVLVTQGRPFEGPVVARLASAGVYVRQFDVLGPFNFSTKINAGVAVASADTEPPAQ